MKVVLQDIEILKIAMDTLSSFITEGTLNFEKDGINLMAMDPSSVAMLTLTILPSMFLEYDVNNEKITIPIQELTKIIKRCKTSERLIFETKENKFIVTIEGNYKRKFYLPIIEPSESVTKAPQLKFNVISKLDSSVIENAVKDASMVSDNIIISADKNGLKMIANGTNSNTELLIERDSPSIESLEVKEDSKAKYSIDYLDRILKATKLSKNIILKFSTDYPLEIEFIKIDKMKLTFILAPRVDN